eukprot:1147169-Pelagomonas_calceolata.AAC.1
MPATDGHRRAHLPLALVMLHRRSNEEQGCLRVTHSLLPKALQASRPTGPRVSLACAPCPTIAPGSSLPFSEARRKLAWQLGSTLKTRFLSCRERPEQQLSGGAAHPGALMAKQVEAVLSAAGVCDVANTCEDNSQEEQPVIANRSTCSSALGSKQPGQKLTNVHAWAAAALLSIRSKSSHAQQKAACYKIDASLPRMAPGKGMYCSCHRICVHLGILLGMPSHAENSLRGHLCVVRH